MALVLPVVVVAGACTDDADSASTGTTTVPSAAGESQNPASATAWPVSDEQVDAAVDQLDGIAQQAMDETGVPGMAIAVVHDDEVVYTEGFGVRQAGSDEPVDENTVFPLASLSKSVGSTVVAGAVGDGTVAWSDPVVEHLPGFALSDPYVTADATVADLYSHRSGLPDHAGDLLEDLGYDRAEILARLRFEPLDPFRDTYAYTNFGLTAAAESVANAASTSWEELSRQRIYEPLDMTSTSSTFADFMAHDNKALGNVPVDGEWQPTPQQREPDAQSPAGGVSSNVVDMANWMRLVLADGSFDGEQVVDPDALGQALTPQITSSPPSTLDSRPGSYGLGIGVGVDETARVRFSHSGAFALGAATNYVLSPAQGLGIIVLTNGAPIGVPEAVTASFMDVALVGSESRDWLTAYQQRFAPMLENPSELAGQEPPADPTPAQADDVYTGTYANEYYGPAVVEAGADGALVLRLGPDLTPYLLTHWDGEVFSWEPPGENGLGITAVTFDVSDGTASSLVVEHLDENGLGAFTR